MGGCCFLASQPDRQIDRVKHVEKRKLDFITTEWLWIMSCPRCIIIVSLYLWCCCCLASWTNEQTTIPPSSFSVARAGQESRAKEKTVESHTPQGRTSQLTITSIDDDDARRKCILRHFTSKSQHWLLRIQATCHTYTHSRIGISFHSNLLRCSCCLIGIVRPTYHSIKSGPPPLHPPSESLNVLS